jgi:outer membrane protein OmpA-like peptidoglycan-associated protein
LDSRRIGEIASNLDEPPQAVTTGMESLTASMLAGMANKAGDSSWMNLLHKLVSQAPSNVNVADLASAATSSTRPSPATSSLVDSGKSFLSLIFGQNQSAVMDAVGSFTGLRSGVLNSLMSLAAPLLMTTLGRLVRDSRMSATGLKDLVTHEADGVRGMLPAGFSDLLRGAPPSIVTTQNTRPTAIGTIAQPTSRNWLWLIPLLLIPLLFYWGYRARHRPAEVVNPPAAIANLGNFVNRSLPDGTILNVPAYGVESQLLGFIQDPNKGIDSNLWFNYDRLLFDTDSATLRPESQEQLRNIAAILRTYPNVHIKIGGYTDNTGDPASNLTLSQDRANGVMGQLVNLGVSADRMEAQGYGEQYPVADNATAAGRAQNRRIAMNVTQK